MEGNLCSKIDWASLIVGGKFTVFALFYFAFEGNFQVQAPGGLIYGWANYLTEAFLRYGFGGLIFGGAYFQNFTVCVPFCCSQYPRCLACRILFLCKKIFTCISTVTRDSLLALHLANSIFNYFILWPQYKNTIILKRCLTKMKKDLSCQQLVCGHANKFLDAAQVFRGQH